MKKVFLLLIVFLSSCKSQKLDLKFNSTLAEEINESIIYDFYDGDTLGKKVYLVK